MNFKPIVNFKKVYKTFSDDVGFTIKMSGTITVALLIIYLIFALILNQIGSLSMLGFFEYFIAIIGICLVLGLVSPFMYSFFAINGGLHTQVKDKIKYTSFLKTYLLGTRPPFSGQLRLSMNLLKAICVDIILGFIASMIVYFISFVPGSELNLLVNEISKILTSAGSNTNEMMAQLENLLLAHEDFINELGLLTQFLPLLCAVYYFLHTICKYTLKYYLATALGPRTPKPIVEFIFVKTIKMNRKEYNLNYYSTTYPLTILFIVSFTLSYFLLGYFGPTQMSLSILALTAIVIGIIVCLPFLPIIFNTHEAMWEKFSVLFMGVFLENAQKELEAYKANNAMAAKIGAENLKKAEGSVDGLRNGFVEELKKRGYEESDFEGLDPEEIYKGYAEDDSYLPYKRKMERLAKEKNQNSESEPDEVINASSEEKKDEEKKEEEK